MPFSSSFRVLRVAFQGVALVHLLLHLGVLVGEFLGLVNHALDLLLGQTALLGSDGDLLGLAGASVLGGDLEHAVGVDLERGLDLRNATGRGRDAVQFELAQQVVVLGHGSLAFVHLDHHGRLVVLVRGERLRLLGGNNRVTFDELRHHSAHSLNAEGQGCHVEQQNVTRLVATFATEDAALHCSAVRHGLVRVDAAVRLLAVEEVLEQLLLLGDASGPANHHELVDLALGQATVVHHILDGAKGLLEQVHVEVFETRAGQSLGEVDAVVQRLDLQAGLVLGRQGALHALHLAAQLLHGTLVLGHVGLVLLPEQFHEVRHHALVEVLTAEVGVAVSGQHFEHTIVNCQKSDIEGATTQVEHEDVLLATFLVQAIGNCRGSGLVDDALHGHA